MPDTAVTQNTATVSPRESIVPSRSALPQFAVDAANRQIGKVGGALTGAADSIESLFEDGSLPFGGELQGLATDAATRLRRFGETASEQDAGAILDEVQRAAAARPALTIAIGAVLGAALSVLLVRTAPSPIS